MGLCKGSLDGPSVMGQRETGEGRTCMSRSPGASPCARMGWSHSSQEVHGPLKELLCPPSWVADADFMCLQEAETVFKHKIIMIRCVCLEDGSISLS